MTSVGKAGASRLRFVFADAVVAFDVADTPTVGQIAGMLRQLSNLHYGDPIDISLTLGLATSRDRSAGSGRFAATWRRMRQTGVLRLRADGGSDLPN